MAYISIDCQNIKNETSRCSNAINDVSKARNNVYSNANALDYSIKTRANIANRLNRILSNMNDINNHIGSIQSFCVNSTLRYMQVDNNIKNNALALMYNNNIQYDSNKSYLKFKP